VNTRLKFPVLAVLAVALSTAGAQQAPTLDPALSATRAALEKYQDPMVAVRDGYYSTVACIEFKSTSGDMAGHNMEHMDYKPGAMGVHFLNLGNVGPTLDPLKPQVLLYEIVGKKLKLTGAEWFVPTALAKTPPMIFGQTLQGPMEGHQPIMPEGLHHWDLHVWLFKDNPAGMFSPTNAAVKCPVSSYAYSFQDSPPKTVQP